MTNAEKKDFVHSHMRRQAVNFVQDTDSIDFIITNIDDDLIDEMYDNIVAEGFYLPC